MIFVLDHEQYSMTGERPVIHLSTPAVAIAVVALLGTLVALAILQPSVAILFVIFGFIFGDNLLGHVTTALDNQEAESSPSESDPETALERLRTRYADGELSESAFERRLEVLLETETVADVERYLEERTGERTEDNVSTERERA